MNPKTAIRFALIMMVVYIVAAGVCMYNDDHSDALVFLGGSLIWIASIFVWSRAKEDGEDHEKGDH